MKGRAAAGLAAAVALALVPWAGACAPRDETRSAISPHPSEQQEALNREPLRPVSLPDLSQLAESVRGQVRERHVSLMRKIEKGDASSTDVANAYGELGQILMAAEFDDAAASCYLHAQALAPNDVRWPYSLGHLYRARGEEAQASAFFERALELRPTDLATLVWLGETYLDQGRPEAAEPLFIRALSLQPDSAAALFGAGRATLAKHSYAQAAEYLERALAVDKRASSIHYSLGMAYRGLGEPGKAEAHLQQRGSGTPTPPDPWMQQYHELLQSALAHENRGLRALEGGDLTAAVKYFQRGLELEPDNPSLRHRLGTALFMTGDARGAVEQFEEVLRRSPGFARAHFSLGVILDTNGRHQESIERFSAAVKYQPNYAEARMALAEALRVTGRLQASLPHYEQAVRIDPGIVAAWMGGAMALAGLGRYQAAREWLTDARHVHPDQPELADLLVRLNSIAR